MKLNAYQCPENGGVWHYGHPPPGGRAEAERMQRRARSTGAARQTPARSALYKPAGNARRVLGALLAHDMPLYIAELARLSGTGSEAACYWLRFFVREGLVDRLPMGPDGYVRYELTEAGRKFASINSVADILRYYARPMGKREKAVRDKLVNELWATRRILAAVAADLGRGLHPSVAVTSIHRAMASIDQVVAQMEYVARADAGEILRHIRCFREMSTSQVAVRLNISNRMVIKAESGGAIPSQSFLRDVTGLYDVPLGAFLVPARSPTTELEPSWPEGVGESES